MPEAMKLLGSTKIKITKNENAENVPNLKITKVVLVHCNIVNNNYQQNSRVLFTFVPNKSFGQLLKHNMKNETLFELSNMTLFSSTQRSNICKRLWIFVS